MKYKNKPMTVEATRFDPYCIHKYKLPNGVNGFVPGGDNYGYSGGIFWVTTIQDVQTPIKAGEWVITEDDGIHHYPCSDEVFRKRYQVDEINE